MKIETKNYTYIVFLFFLLSSCSQVEYNSLGQGRQQVEEQVSNKSMENSILENAESLEKPDYKVIYRKSNLETLSIGRNRIEIEELMGKPDGKSLDGGNGYLWDYRRPVFDELSEETYGWSLISFKFLKGLCAYVNIRLENLPPEIIKLENLSN